MDMTQYGQSEWLTPEIVKQSPTKMGRITQNITLEEGKFGVRPKMEIEIDGYTKSYQPSKDTVRNLILAYDKMSEGWINKEIRFQTINVNGQERVLGLGNV